jgi:hypothetical protein
MISAMEISNYDSVHGQRVVAIWARNARRFNDGSTVCDVIEIQLERSLLFFSVNVDSDEVHFEIVSDLSSASAKSPSWKKLPQLEEYCGKELGWYWRGHNQLGYADLVLLGFSGIEPQVAFCGVASSLCIYKLTKI